MPSLEYRLQWHARGSSGLVSVWRPLAPPGYAPLGDVATLGREPPPQPVQVPTACVLATDAVAEVSRAQRKDCGDLHAVPGLGFLACLCALSYNRWQPWPRSATS